VLIDIQAEPLRGLDHSGVRGAGWIRRGKCAVLPRQCRACAASRPIDWRACSARVAQSTRLS